MTTVPQRYRRTDGRTDDISIAIPRPALRGKNTEPRESPYTNKRARLQRYIYVQLCSYVQLQAYRSYYSSCVDFPYMQPC